MSDDLRRLVNTLERATEDLANARVLLDAALRRVEDQVQDFRLRMILRGPAGGCVGKPACRTPAGNGRGSRPRRRPCSSTPLEGQVRREDVS
jgi:hypothetical protein